MTNATNFEDSDEYEIFKRKNAFADTTAHTIVLDEEVIEDESKFLEDGTSYAHQISISGMEEAQTAAAGKFTVTVDSGKTTITFVEADTKGEDGNPIEIEVQYKVHVAARVAEINNRQSAVGEALLKYPVYSDGSDCTESGILGYVFMHVYRARVTAQPGLNGSYKTAS